MSDKILTISELNQHARQLLEQQLGQRWLTGEISNFSRPASGHWYFSLKDAKAQVRCAMFRQANQHNKFMPDNGQHVVVKANITLYEPRGEYQLVIEKLMLDGLGALQQRFEQLKAKLQLEGLFDPQYKKALPALCRRVGIITSSSGAALQDILHILKRRDPQIEIIIYPSVVQGVDAPQALIRALTLANRRKECDLLIIGRGGGSLEDLWCFNDEKLARAIFDSQIPIVSAVGHETDTTLSDLVADLRAPTPSAAAEMISRDRSQLLRDLQLYQQRIEVAMDYFVQYQYKQINAFTHRVNVHQPRVAIAHYTQRLTHLRYHLQQKIQQQLVQYQQQLQHLQKQCQAHHPQLRLLQQRYQVNQIEQQFKQLIQQRLNQYHSAFTHNKNQLLQQTPQHQLTQGSHQLSQYYSQLTRGIKQQLLHTKQKMTINASQLHAVSPLATLTRGYSITLNQTGTAIRSIDEVSLNENLTIQLNDGQLSVQVEQLIAQK